MCYITEGKKRRTKGAEDANEEKKQQHRAVSTIN